MINSIVLIFCILSILSAFATSMSSKIIRSAFFFGVTLFLIAFIFILVGCLWISVLQGIGSIIFLTAGFLFGVYFGTVISVLTLSLGSSLTYIFANFFFKDLIKKN